MGGNNKTMKVFLFLKSAYYRLFYFFFRIHKSNSFGGEVTDVFAACLAVLPFSIVFFTDSFTIEHFISRFIIELPSLSKVFHLIVLISIVLINYVLFYHRRRYLAIKNQFANESRKVRVKRTLCCTLFSVLSMFSVAIFDVIFGRQGS